jgi:hypothetical protein
MTGVAIFLEKAIAFGYGRGVWRARTAVPVFSTSEHAFQAHPLGHNDLLGIDPLVISVTAGVEDVVNLFTLIGADCHGASV